MPFYIAAILISITTTVQAMDLRKAHREVLCGSAKEILAALNGPELLEKPVWHGKDSESESGFVVMANPDTGAWTIVQFDNDLACVHAVGTESSLRSLGQKL